MVVTTRVCDWSRLRTVNTTATAFTARSMSRNITNLIKPSLGTVASQVTSPAIIDMAGSANESSNFLMFQPFAIGSDNNTLTMRVIGWRKLQDGDLSLDSWIATLLGQFACVISSTLPGIGTTGPLLATELMADTITTTYGASDRISLSSPANDLPANLVIDVSGFRLVEVQFITDGSSTSCNSLVSRY